MTADTPATLDRRPLKSRQWPIIQGLARFLARRRVTPNSISVAGMVGGVLAGVCLAATSWVDGGTGGTGGWAVRALALAAAGCIQFRLLCNLLDGMVAVEGKMRSPVGEIYNEVPDRVSDAGTLIGAGYAVLSSPALGYLAAVIALIVAYIRAVGKGCGLPYDFAGPMAKQHRMALMTLACLVVVVAPGASIPAIWAGPGVQWGPLPLALAVVIAGGVATVVRRLLRLSRALRERTP